MPLSFQERHLFLFDLETLIFQCLAHIKENALGFTVIIFHIYSHSSQTSPTPVSNCKAVGIIGRFPVFEHKRTFAEIVINFSDTV